MAAHAEAEECEVALVVEPTGGPGGEYSPPTITGAPSPRPALTTGRPVENIAGEERYPEPEPSPPAPQPPDSPGFGPCSADPPNLAGLDPNKPSLGSDTTGELFQQGESLLSGGGAKAVTPRDFGFALLFYASAAACLGFFVIFHLFGLGHPAVPTPMRGGVLGRGVGAALFASATIAFGISVVWLGILNVAAKWMIKLSILFALAASLAVAVLGFSQGWPWVGLLMLGLVGFQLAWFSTVWARADLAATIIGVTVTFTSIYPAVYAVAAASLLAQFVWLWVWSKAATSTIFFFGSSTVLGKCLIVYFVCMLFWTIQVLKNLVHVTTCGTFAQWYFRYPHNHESIQPTLSSLHKACTTSFGSVALGSLLVAVVRTLRVSMNLFCKHWSRMPPCLSSICHYCFVAIERLTSYFNVYAFVHVAVYQRSYFDAAKKTCGIVKDAGVDALINDEFVDVALTMGATCGGMACGFFPAMVGQASGLTDLQVVPPALTGLTGGQAAVVMVLGSALGYTIIMGVLTVVWSSVVTLFVCFAEDALSLYKTKPEVFHALVNAWQQRLDVRLTLDESTLDESMAMRHPAEGKSEYVPPVAPMHTIEDCEAPSLDQQSSLLGHDGSAGRPHS